MRPHVEKTFKKVLAAVALVALYFVVGQLLGDSATWRWIVRILLIGFVAQQLLVVGGMIYLAVKNRQRRERSPKGRYIESRCAISVLRVAIDQRSRASVEDAVWHLALLPHHAATLRQIATVLLRHQPDWRYVGATTDRVKKRANAEALFESHVQDARNGVISEPKPPDGVFLVTIIACAKSPVFDVPAATPDAVRRALELAKTRSKDLFALEVVGTPSGSTSTLTPVIHTDSK